MFNTYFGLDVEVLYLVTRETELTRNNIWIHSNLSMYVRITLARTKIIKCQLFHIYVLPYLRTLHIYIRRKQGKTSPIWHPMLIVNKLHSARQHTHIQSSLIRWILPAICAHIEFQRNDEQQMEMLVLCMFVCVCVRFLSNFKAHR